MTVAELIKFLQTQPQDIKVAYQIYSEQKLLRIEQISILELCSPRQDGWVHDYREDKQTEEYLVFPGN